MPTKPSLTLKRRLSAPPEKVFAAWTKPEQLVRWFAPEGMETPEAACDARVGGRFRAVIRAADGEEHHVSGIYREVIPNEKLVFTWSWRSTPERESLVTVALKGDDGGTLLTLTHEQLFDEAVRDSHEAGWSGALNKLEKYVA